MENKKQTESKLPETPQGVEQIKPVRRSNQLPEKYRLELINAGVKHLQEFGYPEVNESNITTDYIYKQFFKKQLYGTIEDCEENKSLIDRHLIKRVCEDLLGEIGN